MWSNNSSREAVCDICIVLCSILKMVPKCYITFTTCSQLIRPQRPIPHPPATSIKGKTPCCYKFPPQPHYSHSLSFIGPIPSIISLFQICNLLFILFLRLIGPASLHLIKMYNFKLFFKGELFAKRSKAMPRVTGNYSESTISPPPLLCAFSALFRNTMRFSCKNKEKKKAE